MTRGGSKGKPRLTLNSLTRQRVDAEDVDAWFDEMFNHASDRAAALVGAAAISNDLKVAIMLKLRPLSDDDERTMFDEEKSPIGDFHSRIEIAYAVRAITQRERESLHHIRRVRNAFAHTPVTLKFDHPLVGKECAGIYVAKSFKSTMEVNKMRYCYGCIKIGTRITKMHSRRLRAEVRRLQKAAAEPQPLINKLTALGPLDFQNRRGSQRKR